MKPYPSSCIATKTYLEGRGVGTDDLLDSLTLVEEDKGGHGLDTDLLSDLLLDVDVDLVEAELLTGRGVRDLLEDGADDPAGTAPGGPEVDDDGLVAVDLFESTTKAEKQRGSSRHSKKEGAKQGGSVTVQLHDAVVQV